MNLNKKIGSYLIISFLSIFLFASSNFALAYNPESVQMYNSGIDLSKNGNFKEAITMFKKATLLDASFVDAYYNLASLYEYLGNESQAILYYEAVFRKNPEDSETAYKLASLYYKKNDYNKALSYLRSIKPDNIKYQESQVLYKKIEQDIKKQTQLKLAQTAQKISVTAKPAISKNTASKSVNINKNVNKVEAISPVNETVNPSSDSINNKMVYHDFQGPTGITQDSKENLYVANYTANTIVRITPEGKRVIIAYGKPVDGPIGLAVDSADNIYVANYISGEIAKITPEGKISVILRGISKPYYLYIDKNSMLYISEQGTNTVTKVEL